MLSLEESNNYIINLIKKNNAFLISRLGFAISLFSVFYDKQKNINNLQEIIKNMSIFDGIYFDNNENAIIYANIHNECIKNSNALAIFPKLYNMQQEYYISKHNIDTLYNRSLEPFYIIDDNIKPWTHYLYGKRVLIISPFIESFKKQLDNNFQIFKDPSKKIFLDNQDFIFYKTFQCLAGKRPHKNWLETFTIMCEDIKNLDFDIALLGCGGYGLPLCNFIKTKMNKSSIYLGGGLQLLFGVMGKRWENNEFWKKIILENDCKFIRPSNEECFLESNQIEGDCYW